MTDISPTNGESSAALRQVEKSSQWFRTIGALFGTLILVAVLAFGWLNNAEQNAARHHGLAEQAEILSILNVVRSVTDPNSSFSKQNQAESAVIINKLISCVENHEDRLVMVVDHKKVPPVKAGCPTEGAPLSLLPPTGGK